MRTVWKFQIQNIRNQRLSVPSNCHFLSAAIQGNAICLWALVDPESHKKNVEIDIFGTGWDIPEEPRSHIATIQDGSYVWHIFGRL